ncbi:MAG TPA: hypothetical protein VGZ22_22045, partial [Isosphaeraceae bacterium]|nr:hypothetical protein [Isosphaeraceae bacterium]
MLAAFLVFLLSLAQEPPEPARTAQVVVEALDVLDEPDALGFVTGQLRRGDQVLVREEAQAGWLAIEPPKGSFGWIDQDAIEEDGGRSARVVAERASIRSGRAGARMPGRPRTTVEQGETVT